MIFEGAEGEPVQIGVTASPADSGSIYLPPAALTGRLLGPPREVLAVTRLRAHARGRQESVSDDRTQRSVTGVGVQAVAVESL